MAKHQIRSETAGTVSQIPVAVGATIAADASVAIIEVMKMELPLPAPVAGTIVSLHVNQGDAVNEGDLIAVIEASG